MTDITKKSLSKTVAVASVWILCLRVSKKAVTFASTFILARLLAPEDYGVVAVGMICILLFQVLTEAGVKQNLIRMRDHDSKLLSTAWTFELIRGLLSFSLIFIAAPLVSSFFRQPEATGVIRALGIVPLLKALENIKVIYFERELHFHKLFIYEISGVVAGVAVAIVSAIMLRNAWALVLGQIATVVVPTILSYVLFPEFLGISLDREVLKRLYGFGKWIFLSSLVSYFAMQGDKFFVGRLFDVKTLGLYSMGAMLAGLIVQEFGKSITRVLFPVYAKINDIGKLKDIFCRCYECLVSVLATACLGLYVVADDFIPVALGSKWLGVIPIIRVLAIASIARALCVSAGGLFLAMNKPEYMFFNELVRAVCLLGGLLVLPLMYGVNGVVISIVIANAGGFVMNIVMLRRVIGIRIGEYLRIYSALVVILAVVFVSMYFVKFVVVNAILRLILSIVTGLASYALAGYVLWKRFGIGPAGYILSFVKAKQRKVEIAPV